MKRILTILPALLLAAAVSAQSPQPRVRTSAPAEKTLRPAGESTPVQQPQPAAKPEPKAKAKAPKKASPAGQRFMALKTNLAYDVFAVLNADFEIQVAPKVTVDVPVMWSLWDWKEDLGLRVVAVQPEARYWFSKAGQGNAVGVSIGAASYNFRHDAIRYQNTGSRPMLSVAASYTYSMPLADRWNAEFTLAVGYVNARSNRYYNISNGAKINSKDLNYFGPTRLGISLVYRLGK